MNKCLILLTLLLCVTTVMAEDYYVNTDSKLREAIAINGAEIILTADIELSNSTLYYPSASMTINSCRAHFRLEGLDADDVASARMFFGDEEATGIDSVSEECGVKDNEWYDLSGRKYFQKPTQKGIYIRNGYKSIIK